MEELVQVHVESGDPSFFEHKDSASVTSVVIRQQITNKTWLGVRIAVMVFLYPADNRSSRREI